MNWEDTGLWHVALFFGVIAWGWAILHILTTRYTSAGTSAWLLAIILLPYVGVPLYAIFGGRKLKRVMRRKARIKLHTDTVVDYRVTGEIDRMLRGLGIPGATCGNQVQLLPDGVASWHALFQLIEEAEKSIDLLIYLVKNDVVGKAVIERLALKAKEGVSVRLLYDSLGSLATSSEVFRPLAEAGGRAVEFMPAGWWPFRTRTNLRNHRKLMVVDGKQAWAGGMNIGEEYLGPTPRTVGGSPRWLDLSFLIEGPAVEELADIFRSDWAFAMDEEPGPPPEPVAPVFYGDEGIVQIVPSGPDVEHDPLYATLVAMTFLAKQRLWIATPYYVPNEPLSNALCLASLRGVDVRVLVPRRSNHRLPDLARGPYLRDLQEVGGKVHLVERMMHAKCVVMDDALTVHGSANLDARSLFLNFEVATICYSRSDVDAARRWMESLIEQSQPRTMEVTYFERLTEGAMRLVAPLL